MFEGIYAEVQSHRGAELLRLKSNRERAIYCAREAMKWRMRYWDGQARYVEKALHNDTTLQRRTFGKWKHKYPESVRIATGQKRWSLTVQARDCISNEQMWQRFSDHFSTLAQLDHWGREVG